MIKPSRIDEAIMRMNDKSLGGVIRTKEAAIEFAELIIRNGNVVATGAISFPCMPKRSRAAGKLREVSTPILDSRG
jgi:hypothetical protein